MHSDRGALLCDTADESAGSNDFQNSPIIILLSRVDILSAGLGSREGNLRAPGYNITRTTKPFSGTALKVSLGFSRLEAWNRF